MKVFRAILQAHSMADMYLESKESRTRSIGGKTKWTARRMYNDHAYFLLLFARLENQINCRCETLIARKMAVARWKAKRLWDTVGDVEQMEFMKKVALLCEKGHQTYNRIRHYYKNIRCESAHGNSADVGAINLPMAAQELLEMAEVLRS